MLLSVLYLISHKTAPTTKYPNENVACAEVENFWSNDRIRFPNKSKLIYTLHIEKGW